MWEGMKRGFDRTRNLDMVFTGYRYNRTCPLLMKEARGHSSGFLSFVGHSRRKKFFSSTFPFDPFVAHFRRFAYAFVRTAISRSALCGTLRSISNIPFYESISINLLLLSSVGSGNNGRRPIIPEVSRQGLTGKLYSDSTVLPLQSS